MNWKVFFKRAGVIAAMAVIALIGFYHYKQEELARTIADKVIRFHVLANSDSEADQDLKIKVRDAIGSYMQNELVNINDVEKSREIITGDMSQIVATAEQVIRKEGYDYNVTAALKQTEFPRKTYGSYTFPKGEYEALQVVIGAGEGQNWWCVMYPNLCFYNSVYEVVEEEAEESLKKVLTTEEYKAIMESGDYEVRFQWLSFLNR
jgi:stage II sporulation protein R